jgi:hypothetical protein
VIGRALAAQRGRNLAHDRGIFRDQPQARLLGSTRTAGRDHDRVGGGELLDRDRAGRRGRVERAAVREIHGLTHGQVELAVADPQLGHEAPRQDRTRNARADPAHADDSDPHAGAPSQETCRDSIGTFAIRKSFA